MACFPELPAKLHLRGYLLGQPSSPAAYRTPCEQWYHLGKHGAVVHALAYSLSTGWMGENHFANIPVAVYGVNLLLAAIAFYILQKTIMKQVPEQSRLVIALKKQEVKGVVSVVLYLISIVSALFYPVVSAIVIIFTAILWLIPDKRIEAALKDAHK